MRKTIAKQILAGAVSLCMAAAFVTAPVFAADGGYVITFRPGEHGTFTDSFISGLEGTGNEVRVSEATGAVAVLVPEGAAVPNAPTMGDIQINADAEGRYIVTNAAEGYTGGAATADQDTVAQYTLRASTEEAAFQVQHLDRETGAEVAPAQQGTAPIGQVLTFYALNNIENYTPETASQTLTVNANGDQNVVTFYYTAAVNNVTETVTTPGGTVIEYNDQYVTGGAAVAGGGGAGGAGGGGGAGTGEGGGETVTIPEEETPEAETPDSGATTPDDSTVDLPDESTPQTDLPTDDAGSSNMGIVVIGGIAILAVILLGVFLVNRHNKAVDEK